MKCREGERPDMLFDRRRDRRQTIFKNIFLKISEKLLRMRNDDVAVVAVVAVAIVEKKIIME